MSDVVMPRLSDSMEEGTILKWLKATGDAVRRGEPLVEIETDKANMTYDADADGTLEIVAAEGDTLPVGQLIARLEGDVGADAPGGNGAVAAAPEPVAIAREPVAIAREPVAIAPAARVRASPVARRLARERGVELGALSGTGPGGRIVRADVEGAATGEAGEPAPVPPPAAPVPPEPTNVDPTTAKGQTTIVELTKTQQVIARRMSESKATVPEFTVSTDVDMEPAVELRRQLREMALEAVPSYNDMVVRACGLALEEHPIVNGSYRDGRFELHSRVNVGVAVAADDALIVPTVFDADQKGLEQIATETRALAARVRSGEITPPELSGATFTVSNLGMYGVASFTAVINTPQAAILAVGAATPRPVAREGVVEVANTMSMTLACDHRILYGAPAAQFLARVRELLEHPLSLVRSL